MSNNYDLASIGLSLDTGYVLSLSGYTLTNTNVLDIKRLRYTGTWSTLNANTLSSLSLSSIPLAALTAVPF
jgi:hypothetical protein